MFFVVWIDYDLGEWIVGDGVDGEIVMGGGFGICEIGFGFYGEFVVICVGF